MADRGLFDMHCHIVPAVDDGAQSVKEAFAMLQMEYDQGVRKIIVTPHFRREMFETPSKIIKKHFLVLRRLAEKIGPDFKVFLGCEFHANVEMLDYLRSDKVYSMAGSRYVLTEFSSSTEEKYISDRIYELLSGGYRPIIAHIERYRCMHDLDFVEHLVNKGALMQVNADSVIGKNGHAAKKYCGKLLEEELGVAVLGYVPKVEDCVIESRHLGLVLPDEIPELKDRLHKLAGVLEETLDIDQILEEMVYIQFAEVEDFLELMVAAQALPHTDYKRYPTVMEKLKERQKDIKL